MVIQWQNHDLVTLDKSDQQVDRDRLVDSEDGLCRSSGNNDNSTNGSSGSSPRIKEGQTIWQKATSLRQSLRYSSRSKVGHKSGLDFSSLSSGDKSATLDTGNSPSKSQLQIRRDWGSQRNLARERRSLAAVKLVSSDELAASKRSLHSRSLCMSGDWDVEGQALINEDDQPMNPKQPRSPRKLTKDSGYETSAQCDPDYANSLSDWLSDEKAIDQSGVTKPRNILPDKDPRGLRSNDDR
ncbi:uncharacterized protein TNCT_273221 [Trichonephila clavata]|uniref:Uncharacterized protein n=1 Tax=Trichonephila clavata TaxID=2740835 RepID=A0A8X6KKB5_TRICU|nr:uncharacterized protein TNCT_273221 [Trichonephila clavata]